MKQLEPPLASDRRALINSLAAGAATIGLSSLISPASIKAEEFGLLDPENPEIWLTKIKGKHKTVFDATQPHGIFPFAWPRVFLLSNQATGALEKDCCAVVVLRHNAIPYAFEDRLWEKYKFGEVFKAPDPLTNNPALKNPFWKPASGALLRSYRSLLEKDKNPEARIFLLTLPWNPCASGMEA